MRHSTNGTGLGNTWNVSAIMAKSLTWDPSAFARAPTRHPRRRFWNEAVAWQHASQRGGWAGMRSYVDQSSRSTRPTKGPQPDRGASCHDRCHRRAGRIVLDIRAGCTAFGHPPQDQ